MYLFLSSTVRYNVPHSHKESKACRGFSHSPKVTQLVSGRAGGRAQAALGPETALYHLLSAHPTSRLGHRKKQGSFPQPSFGDQDRPQAQGDSRPGNSRVWSPPVLVRSLVVMDDAGGPADKAGLQSRSPALYLSFPALPALLPPFPPAP